MTRAFIVLTMSLLLGGAQVLRAQSARELLGQGVRAYQALEYDAAAALLEESLGRDSSGLADSLRARALTYLGATELFRGQRDSAVATFRHLVLLNPRYRPDELIFPPQVTNLFQEVRRATRAIAVAVPPVTELRTRIERFTARVLTSSLADVTVTLAREDGTLMRQLYSGPVADSLLVSWDGLTAAGTAATDGRYLLQVTPRTPTADGPRARQVLLEVKQEPPDTLAWPPEPPFLPERTSSGPAFRSLAAGLVTGAAAVALPSIMAQGKDATGARFAVGAAVGIAGFVGFFAHKPRPLEANVRKNASQRDAWMKKLDGVKTENATRLRTMRLVVRAGPETFAERRSE
ncbi:MAG: hypothetical protein DMD25_07250 [Gemmatimonadetes bacterium]|nr:MAG: hypothetical protein DMD27_10580 [Gemmatimonadota bacterium]PYP78504.1 MAG: hypothetical protein DMD25_07250 [Gemmatimonadota bacterium]